MFSNKNIILFATLFSSFVHIQSLVELRANETIDIISAETVIRETFNTLFSTLKIRDVQIKPRFKKFSTIHKFFISIALKDCDNLKEIEMLSRVSDVDNETYFITQINEVLNGEDNSDILTDYAYVKPYVETFIKKLRYFKDNYNLYKNLSNLDITTEILQHLSSDELLEAVTKKPNKLKYLGVNILHDNEVWVQNGRRVYKGISVSIKRFPFMASIHLFDTYLCGGSIISSDLIITSATCLQLVYRGDYLRAISNLLSVRIGSTYTERGGEKIGVDGIYFHPLFNPKTLENNLGLVRLNRHITFSWTKGNIKKIDFDRYPMAIRERVIIIGWGIKDNSQVKSKRLSYSVLNHYPLRDCKEVYSKKYVTNKNFCAGFIFKKGGACNRDIGGPGIVDGKLSGILNFGSMVCGAPDKPTVFTSVGYYSDWIRSIMEQFPRYVRQEYKNETNLIKNIQEAAHYPDFTTTDVPVADTKTLQQPVKENEFVSLFNNFKDFVSTIFVGSSNNNGSSKP